MKQIETDLIITSIRAKVDGSLSFTATTPELTAEEKVEVMKLQNVNLYCMLRPTDLVNAPSIKVDKEINQKTPSARLRNTLYVYWTQYNTGQDFEEFYKAEMERIIEGYKAGLI